jgi:catechol 2,3-dioxygenase-like lactoylglutathione lyase family enzyme
MIDHVELLTADLARSTAFYRRALAPLGYELRVEKQNRGFGTDPARIDFFLRNGGPSAPLPHFAFACATRELVDRAHQAALEAGGADNGAPRVLAQVHPSYYAGFVLDPDGHNVEFVCQQGRD